MASSESAKSYMRAYYRKNTEKCRAYVRKYRATHPFVNDTALNRKRWLKKYGLTAVAFENLLVGQGGVCAICGTTKWKGKNNSPCIDHDHVTGKVRGILCNQCNAAIGMLHDDAELAKKVAVYLVDHLY